MTCCAALRSGVGGCARWAGTGAGHLGAAGGAAGAGCCVLRMSVACLRAERFTDPLVAPTPHPAATERAGRGLEGIRHRGRPGVDGRGGPLPRAHRRAAGRAPGGHQRARLSGRGPPQPALLRCAALPARRHGVLCNRTLLAPPRVSRPPSSWRDTWWPSARGRNRHGRCAARKTRCDDEEGAEWRALLRASAW